ncbi:MAG: hypothetical protein O9282_00370 [Flavobacterium sp.]|jgi:hypothetical protein|uniref:hypothetical protein n=1 Tax=Flavobacterium sp. TaxID=239 RepID=UPI0022CC1431|nr:hypothetical protein [Flavobacterium sp.]MCZ8329743.1 hypothetical protein [Flavobacterium sp.]
MKQHIKKIHFLVIALFTIMLSSCSDDLYHHGSPPATKNKTISIEEFKRNTGLHNFSKTFKIPKDNTIAYRNADGSYELSDFDINFDYIKQVVVENKISYTFNIVPKIVTSKSIFNLVVYNHDGNWETSIIELIPTDENFDKLLAGIDNKFEGNIKQVYSARIPGNCYTVAYYVENCTYGDSDACRITCDQCNLCMNLVRYNVCNDTEIMQPLYPISGGGGGVGSGLSDPSGYIFDPNMYELGSKKYQQAKNAAEFWHGLSVSQQQWVYESEQNKETYRDIIAYINRPENINNNEAKNFGREAINALSNGGEVDLVYKIIIDNTLKNNPCLNSVYTQLGKAPTFQNYLKNFDGNFSVANLKLESSTTLPNNINAETSPPSNYTITITFNANNLNRPGLSIARTFVHEMIHAEIFRKLLSCANLPNLNFNNYSTEEWKNFIISLKDNYPGLYDYYLRYFFNVPSSQPVSDEQHQLMAQHYRTIIVNALKEYDNTKPESLYQALAWEGLKNTVAWNNLSTTEKNNINTIINNFNISNTNCQ